jgi:hypothetical protein
MSGLEMRSGGPEPLTLWDGARCHLEACLDVGLRVIVAGREPGKGNQGREKVEGRVSGRTGW